MDEPIRIVICTRHTLLREGIKAMLDREGPIQVAGEAATATEAAALLKRIRPDVILMDPSDPDLGGAEATRLVKSACPPIKILLLALDADASMVADCLRAGASAYIGNSDKPAHLKIAIKGLCGREVRVHAA
jgi:two-component system, NarL family, nitrate/nitrite response regulator NarL